MAMRQANAQHDDGSNKFRVGQRLRFIGYAEHEIAGASFNPGDILTVAESNGCGLGIDVTNEQGLTDMVWPEEVDLI